VEASANDFPSSWISGSGTVFKLHHYPDIASKYQTREQIQIM
jgi:hypothetical protein